ncbi:unnamed protein product [Closterium sp. NIES-54]
MIRSGVAIFDLDYDAILAAMYAVFVSAEGDYYMCVPPDPGIEAAPIGASESALPGTAPAEALHTFKLDSSASRCFFRDSTTITPLSTPIPVRLADPFRGPVLARSSTVLPCLAVLSSSLSGLHLPSFSTNLVSTAALQDAMVTTTTPGGQHVSICMCTRMSRSRASSGSCVCPDVCVRSGSTPLLVSPPVAPDSSVAPPPGSPLHATPSWHALPPPCLGLPRSLPPLPPLPAPPCLPFVEGRQRAAPHSSSFLPTTAPLRTLHMDVWGPARVCGQGHEHYFLLVVNDYTRYTTVFPLRSKGQVLDVLILWIRAVGLQLRVQFHQDLPVLRLHSERAGEFSSDLLRDSSHGEGILQSFTLPDSPQQNGIAEHRIGFVMEPCVSLLETSPTLRWTGKVGDASVFRVLGSRAFVRNTSVDKLAARAIPCVFLGFPPDAPGWLFYHPTSRSVFPSQDVTFDKSVRFYRLFPYHSVPPPPPPLFLAPGPPLVDPLPPQGPAPSGVSQVDPLPGTVPVEVASDSSAARGAASGGAEPGGAEPGGAESEGAGSRGAEPRGAEPKGAEPGGAEPEGVELVGASAGGLEGASPRLSPRPETLSLQQLREWFSQRTCLRSGAAGAGDPAAGDTGARVARVTVEPGGTGGAAAASSGGARTRGPGAAKTGGVGGAGAGDPTEPGAADFGGAGGGGPGAGGAGVGGAGAVHPGAGGAGAGGTGAGGTVRPRPYFVPLLQQALGVPSSTGHTPPLLCPPLVQLQPQLQPTSPLPAASPYSEQPGGLTERYEPASRLAFPVHTGERISRPRPPPIPATHAMALLPSSVPLRVPLPAPPESSLPAVPDPESDLARAASPTVSRLLATIVTNPSFESTSVSALVAESDFASPLSVKGECALGTDVLEDKQEDFECLAAVVPRFASMLLVPEGDPDAPDIPTPRSYAEAITVDGMSIFRVKRPLGSPPTFKAHFVARGFSQRQRVDYFQTFSPTPKMTTLWVSLHVAAQRDYELHSLDFSFAFLQGSLHKEILLRRPPGFTGSFPAGTQWSLRRPVYGLRQAPRKWHDTLRTTLAALGVTPSTADPSLFLRTDTSLMPFYVLMYVDNLITRDRARRTITLTQSHMVHQVLQRFGFQFSSPLPTLQSTGHSLSAPPLEESVEPSGPYPELVGCLMYLMTCTRPDLAYPLILLARYVAPSRHRKVHWDAAKRVLRYLCSTSGMGLVLGGWGPVVLTGHAVASWVDDSATQRSSQGYIFILGSGSVSWRSTRSSSVLSSSCEAKIYAGAMAAQELRWLTYLQTDPGEQPRSPPVLYVDNKAMIALCQEHRLEHRTKRIAMRYFLARDLQQRGQLRLAYVATRAKSADIFTKALPPGDHQRFSTVLRLVPTLPHLLTT